jgi:hypothetical protein
MWGRDQCLHGDGDHRYYAKVLKEDWRLGLDILADILTDPVLDPAEVARERDVILQEIAAANDSPTIWCSIWRRRRPSGPCPRPPHSRKRASGWRL